jgi:hypothetical protein
MVVTFALGLWVGEGECRGREVVVLGGGKVDVTLVGGAEGGSGEWGAWSEVERREERIRGCEELQLRLCMYVCDV